MDWLLFRVKTLRIIRRMPMQALDQFALLFSKGNLISFFLALIGSYIIVQGGTEEAVVAELISWEISVQAFGIVLLGWAALSILSAPIFVVMDDRKLGSWYGRRFVYKVPHLVATFRCKATGEAQFHKFKLDHVEPNAFVEYTIELENELPREYISAIVVGVALLGQYQTPGQGVSKGGTRIGADRSAQLLITMRQGVTSQTVRVYCRSFTVGNPDDTDGSLGTSRKPLRKTA